jgi:predicted metal-dependent peptidase
VRQRADASPARARLGRRRLDRVVRRRLALAAATGAWLLSGCGGVRAADLFVVQRSGSVPSAQLMLLVDEEGGVSCNGGRTLKLSDSQLIEARAIQEDMRKPAEQHLSLAPGPRSVFSYRVRQEQGSVSFSDDSPNQPQVFHRLALFVLQTSQRVCHLPL